MPAIYINAHKKQSQSPVTPLQLMGRKPKTKPSTAEEVMYALTTLAMSKRGNQNG